MEVTACSLTDDVFFDDLNKQISLLIMDDDDYNDDPVANSPSVSLLEDFPVQYSLLHHHHPSMIPTQALLYRHHHHHYDHEQHHHNRHQQQQQVISCRISNEIRGTGVFIPSSSQSRRNRNEQQRHGNHSWNNNQDSTNSKSFSNKQLANSRGLSPRHQRHHLLSDFVPSSHAFGSTQNGY